MIPFPKSLTIESCEKLLNKLQIDAVDELEFPVETAKYAFSGMAAAIQSGITWARNSASCELYLRETKKDLGLQIEEITKRPHKLAAAMFAKAIFAQVDGEQKDIRQQVNEAAKLEMDAQETSSFGLQYGRLCWFAFVDHSTKGFVRNFYLAKPNEKPEPRQREQIRAIIRNMVEKSAAVAGGGVLPSSEELDHLGRVFYELFLNTHEHGSRGFKRSEWLKPGVRVIYTYGINLSDAGVAGTIKEEPVLERYVDRDRQKARYIEISIVDSGLGYCARWLADHFQREVGDLSIEDEYDIFKKCFKFRQSSSEREHKGNGLPVVMDRLTKLRGFMRVRSGRLALYRDFVESPYSDDEGCEFYDWASQRSASDGVVPNASVSGVAITLLIPLEGKHGA